MSLLLLLRRWRTAVAGIRRFNLSASASHLRPMAASLRRSPIATGSCLAAAAVASAGPAARLDIDATVAAVLTAGVTRV